METPSENPGHAPVVCHTLATPLPDLLLMLHVQERIRIAGVTDD